MALTLRSSTSFISKTLKSSHKTTNLDEPPSLISFVNPHKPLSTAASCRLKATRASSQDLGPVPAEQLHPGPAAVQAAHSGSSRVPVYVMLPLDTIFKGNDGKGAVNRARALNASMMALRSAGVEGIMADVWWGLVERDGPMKYDWEGYAELVRMAERNGLKMQMVMSFHQCGGNVGDSCSIPLPLWVLEEMSSNPDIVYTDRSGRRNPEYISLGCDELPVLHGRTPIQVYSDYMRSFRDRFTDYLGNVIVEIQVGMGPCGELRYPSYPESNGTWRFPGIGEFQCYDKYMKASLQAAATAAGCSKWGQGGPHDAGQYNQFPEDTGFFKKEGTWNSDYGKFFLSWYSNKLLQHGDRILAAADSIFSKTGARLSTKVAGIHWHYRSRSHAAELTAGYYNTRYHDGYIPIAKMLAKRGAILNFTCMEMKDEQQPGHAGCAPELLVQQVKNAASSVGVELAGENALERYDEGAYAQVLATNKSESGMGLSAFTYLRLNKRLFEEANWRQFVSFVKAMEEGGRRNTLHRSDLSQSDLYVGFVNKGERKPEAEAAAAAF